MFGKSLILTLFFFVFPLPSYGQSKAEYKIDLDAYISEQSSWTQDLVEQRLILASQVFLQCDLDINWRVEVSPMLSPLLEKSMDSSLSNGLKKVGRKFPSSNSLRLFFVDEFSLEGKVVKKQSGFARGVFDDVPESLDYPISVLNTVWAPYQIINLPNSSHCGGAQYSILAHELTHVLAQIGSHNPDQPYNLLSLCMIGGRNNFLSKAQCRKITSHPMVVKKK